jgi:hypothetical protein
MKKLKKIEILANLLWIAFGVIGGLDYFSRKKYLVSGIMFLVAVLYTYKLGKYILDNQKSTSGEL